MKKRRFLLYCLLVLVTCVVASCSVSTPETGWEAVYDSTYHRGEGQEKPSFFLTHHYSRGYNFVVSTDRLCMQANIPLFEASCDTSGNLPLSKGDELIVLDIDTTFHSDASNIWIKLVHNASEIGWIKEDILLRNVVPNDPISQTTMFFSEVHKSVAGILLLAFLCALGMRVISYRRHCKQHPGDNHFLSYMPLPHINDICSPYPLLLYLTIAGSAVFYSSLQLYSSETWQHFYFHPTLNPFGVPALLSAFLVCVWLIITFLIATLIDVVRQLYFVRMCLYTISMFTLVGTLYVFFSWATLHYVGYVLYPIYFALSVWYYIRHTRPLYRCGFCGTPMNTLGRCRKCHRMNTGKF